MVSKIRPPSAVMRSAPFNGWWSTVGPVVLPFGHLQYPFNKLCVSCFHASIGSLVAVVEYMEPKRQQIEAYTSPMSYMLFVDVFHAG